MGRVGFEPTKQLCQIYNLIPLTAREPTPFYLLIIIKTTNYVNNNNKFNFILDKTFTHTYSICVCMGRLAQLGERLPYKQEVIGSIPIPPIFQIKS